jgi:hypothetical protein
MQEFESLVEYKPHASLEATLEERPVRRRERRLLVLALFLCYIAGLGALWYAWNAPQGWFDTSWKQFAFTRFAPIVLSLVILCACYSRLRRITGPIMGWREKSLDERQRMVRDKAHSAAYKIITLASVALAAFTGYHSIFASPPAAAPSTPIISSAAGTWVIRPIASQYISDARASFQHIIKGIHNPAATKQILIPGKQLISVLYIHPVPFPHNAPPPHLSFAATSPYAWLNQGIFFGLLLLAILLIVYTLPKAIIAWKERW